MTPEKIQGELSLQHLYKVYDTVVNTYGMKPIIFDADDLQKNPGMQSLLPLFFPDIPDGLIISPDGNFLFYLL